MSTETTRELLELAAKATGWVIDHARQAERDADMNPARAGLWIKNEKTWWHPGDDDGDSRRLEVKLGIVPRNINGVVFAWADGVCDIQVKAGKDPYAAMRLAVLLAAAEIGRRMP